MPLFGCLFIALGLGLASLLAVPTGNSGGRAWLDTLGFSAFFFAFPLLSALLVTPLAMWLVPGAAAFMLAFSRWNRMPKASPRPLITGLILAVLALHFTVSLTEVAISTRQFDSDRELVSVALQRCRSVPALLQTASFSAAMAAGAGLGLWLGTRRARMDSKS